MGTARPSISVGPGIVTGTTSPASIAAAIDGHRSGSTPMICTRGLIVFTARAMPAINPPPPTGTTMASTFSASSKISRPTLPAPAMMSKSSKPLMYFMPSFSTYSRAARAASAMESPSNMTLAPKARHFVIFVSGAMDGMSTVTGMPSSAPWYASAKAWFPAEAATTPFWRCSASRARRAFRAPRSLNEPVACCHSCLRKMFISVTAESARERAHGVRTTPLRMRKCAAETSSNEGRSWPFTTWRGVHPAATSAARSGSRMLHRTPRRGRPGRRSFREHRGRERGRGAAEAPRSAPANPDMARGGGDRGWWARRGTCVWGLRRRGGGGGGRGGGTSEG